jgi:hypothetical protein
MAGGLTNPSIRAYGEAIELFRRRRSTTARSHVLADRSHDRHDLLDCRRVGRVLLSLITRRATAVIARKPRGRWAMTSGIQQHGFHEPPIVRLTMCCHPTATGRAPAEITAALLKPAQGR